MRPLTDAGREDVEALVAFLRARLSEDESRLQGAEPGWMLDRLTAQCRAHRKIISAWRDMAGQRTPYSRLAGVVALQVFMSLARPYADHPEFRESWALPELGTRPV